MKKLYFAIFYMIFVELVVFGQNEMPEELKLICATCTSAECIEETTVGDCSHSSPLWSNNLLWLPSNNFEDIQIRVNMIFLHKASGSGNFMENDPEHDQLLNDLFNQVNFTYNNLINSTDPDCYIPNNFLPAAKIQIIPNILHIEDEYGWNNESDVFPYCPGTSNWYLNYLDDQIINNPDIPRGINVYFTETEWYYEDLIVNQTTQETGPINNACSQSPTTVNLNRTSKIHMPNVFTKYWWMKNIAPSVYNQPWNPVIRSWFIGSVGKLLAHELGHSFWLYHNNSCQWNIMSQNPTDHKSLFPDQIGKIHRSLSITNVRNFSTEESYITIPYIINENTLWDLNCTMYRDIIVESGKTLTVTCKLVMKKNAKIIIKQGGILVVDGGTITSAHELPWQGIQVWGNSSAHQWPDGNGNYQQGRLVLNNATIENAIVAVDLWKDGEYSKTGGIVQATNSSFVNNVRAVHALQYRNFHPVNFDEMPYNSSFTNCTFEINADYPGYETFFKHVDLSLVNGLRFNGCDFSLSPDAPGVSDYNQAIAAYSAGFRVDAPCNNSTQPCSSYDHSTFNDFRVGIYAAGGLLSPYTYYINRAQFNGNTIGVLSNNVNNAIILNSEFHAAKNQYNWELCTYGIFMQAANGFTIEDNQFFKQQGAPLSNYIGIGVFDCNAIADVYRNEFTGLTAGNYAYGKNWAERLYHGVEYLCNTNTSNWADFYVTGNPILSTNGVQSKQGVFTLPARNTFSASGATWHFYNETQNLIGYYYCQSCPDQYPDYVLNVTREPVNITGSCPSHYGSDTPERSVVMDATEFLEAETAFAQSDYDYQGVKTLYNNLKDGGSTEEAIFDVSTAQPSQMWEIRSKLLGDSPYLSTEVLKLAADRTDMFTEAAIFDILAANPDELKKEELMKYLEEKENPLPDYMLNILKQVAEGTSYRTVLELQMSRHSHDRAQAANDIIRSILNADELDMGQLQLWLTNLGGLEAEKQLIASYVHQGDYSTALALAETLPVAYKLQDEQLLDHNQYMSLLQLQQNLKNSGRTMNQLTTAEQQQLTEIAESETASSSAMAKSVLELFYGAGFERCLPIDDEASYKSSAAADLNRLAGHYGMSISAKPNPAGDWAAFDYTLPEGTETALLEITDASGKTIATYTLQGSMGQQLADTRQWPAGQYVYTLKAAGFTQSGKLVVK